MLPETSEIVACQSISFLILSKVSSWSFFSPGVGFSLSTLLNTCSFILAITSSLYLLVMSCLALNLLNSPIGIFFFPIIVIYRYLLTAPAQFLETNKKRGILCKLFDLGNCL